MKINTASKNKKQIFKNQIFLGLGLISISGLGACSTIDAVKNGKSNSIASPKIEINDFRDMPPAASDGTMEWWQKFSDNVLNQLISDAKNENLDLALANSRLIAARALGRATVAGYAPRLDAINSISSTKVIDGPSLTNAKTGGDENSQSTNSAVLSASWELPLFGRLGNSIKGAKANVMAAQINVEAAKIALVSDLAAAYYDLRNAQISLQYLQNDIEQAQLLNDITQDRYRVGLISKSDASLAQSSLSGLEARLPDAKLLVRAALNRISIIRGVSAGSLDEMLALKQDFTFSYNAPKITEVPADFVRRRLDVRQAEQNAILQAAGLGISKADLYPKVSIGGTISLLSALSGNPLPAAMTRSGLAPQISLPLFDFGQKKAAVTQAKEAYNQALLNYRGTTLNAIAEGQQAISAYDFARDRLIASQKAEEAANIRLNAAKVSFKAGLIALKERVEAERDYASARNSRLSAQAAYSDAAIGLYRAFAGSPEII